jgi:hypothetical protein
MPLYIVYKYLHFALNADLSFSSSDLMRDAMLERMTEADRKPR